MTKKLIVLTGASSGIGYALAKELASRGENVLAIARRENLLRQLESFHQNVQTLPADVASADGRQKIINYLQQQNQSIHLIHNAGIAMPKTLEHLTEEDWQKALRVNLEGPLWLTKACLPFFDGSRVLHTSSGLAHRALAGTCAYSITKAALYMLYQVINAEMDPKKVIAGSLRPGVIDTPMQVDLRSAESKYLPSQEYFHDMVKNDSLKRPEAVAVYMADVLLNTDDDAFKAKEWDINT
jgi:NAD(P)-dependent dehydrogenase (short-subunit alcohol dehydrogenase family)